MNPLSGKLSLTADIKQEQSSGSEQSESLG